MLAATRRDFLLRAALAACGAAAGRLAPFAGAVPPGPSADDRSDDLFGLLADSVEVVRRAEWTTTRPRLDVIRAAGEYRRLTVHHTASPRAPLTDPTDVAQELEGILTGHMERHFGDLAYHLAIDHAGRVWEGRPLAYEGAHVLSANEGNLGIVLLGDFDAHAPSPAQQSTLEATVSLICHLYDIPGERVYGHRELASSACPGKHLFAGVRRFRETLGA
jgi:hypothetical protein